MCAAHGKEPNRQSLLAIEQIERGEAYEYTGAIGAGMIDRILNGETVKKVATRQKEGST